MVDRDNDPVLSKVEKLREGDLLNVLKASYISERFFGHGGAWFSQKLNNHLKNGNPCEFTQSELRTLGDALETIALELQNLADELRE